MRSRYVGNAARAAALGALAVSGVLYAQALNLRPGNYEFITTTDLKLPPQAAAALSPDMLARLKQPQTSQHCITASDVSQAGRKLAGGRQQSDPSCKMTGQSRSGSELKFVLQCTHNTMHFDGTFAAESYQATMVMTSDQGQTTTVNLTAHRIGDCSK
jgi:Protein of unknown function (DUF3617)